MSDVLQRLRQAAPAAFADQPMAFAYLFGSHATGGATPRSDVDVAVHLTGMEVADRLVLRLELAAALERTAGIGPVEVVILDDAPLALAGRVYLHGIVFFSTDEVARVRYESLTGRMYRDFRYHESRIAQQRLQRMARADG